MEQILDVAKERAAEAYSEGAEVQKKQISPAILTLIIDVAMELVQSCMKTNTAQGVLDNTKNEFMARLSIRRTMRRMNERPNEEIISSVLRMAQASNAQEVEQFHAAS